LSAFFRAGFRAFRPWPLSMSALRGRGCRPIAEIVEELAVIEAEARETDKALRGILKQLGVSA
jgi:hypothetical protein